MAKWSREQIIHDILSREAAGLPLALGGNQGVGSALYNAGARVFGSWCNAVRAAGIAPQRAKTKYRWSACRIRAVIRDLARRPCPLRPGELEARHGPLVAAAQRYFGSWSKAVLAAGVDPAKLRKVLPWTRERIIEGVLTRALQNQPLGGHTVQPRSLAKAGARVFGTWDLALVAAGLDPKRYGSRPSGATIAPANGRRCRHGGLTVDSPTEDGDPQDSAVPTPPVGEGIVAPHEPGQSWSAQQVVQAILVRLRERRSLNAAAIYREDRGLYKAAASRHGSWGNALLAAGLNPDDFRKNRGYKSDRHGIGLRG